MSDIKQTLNYWKTSLCPKIELGGLFARNPIAHKWKAPFRSLILREAVFWRIHDLLSQSYALHEAHHALGSRILLRSALETLATLVYINQLMRQVVAGTENFHSFSEKTSRLLLGSKNQSTRHEAVNILTVLKKCDKKYPGLWRLYETLSESAHPNFEGMCFGYSRVDDENYVSVFSNNMREMYEHEHISSMELCIRTFEEEYNNEWSLRFEEMETWIAVNDEILESTKRNG